MPDRSRRGRRWLVGALLLTAVAVPAARPANVPSAAPADRCPPVRDSAAAPTASAPLPYQGARFTEIVRDQAVPGTIGAGADLPDSWTDEPERENERLLLCEYLLSTDPPTGATCSYDLPGTGMVDLRLVTGRYRYLVLATDTVRARFELPGRPDAAEVCPTMISPTQRHAPVVYPPRQTELLAALRPLVAG